MKTSMIATKAMTYGTRRLKAGDEFVASRRDARLLAAIGRAEYSTAAMKSEEDELQKLRAAYQEKIGKRPYHGWDADTIKAKMAEADKD